MTDRQLEQRLRSWYQAQLEDAEDPSVNLAPSVLAIPDAMPARQTLAERLGLPRSWVLAATLLMLLAFLIGSALVAGSGLNDFRLVLVGPTPSPSVPLATVEPVIESTPTPTGPPPTDDPEAEPTPLALRGQGDLLPGRYAALLFPYRVILTLPEGYSAFGTSHVWKYSDEPLRSIAVGIWAPEEVRQIYVDPCHWSADAPLVIDPTVDDFVVALSGQPRRDATAALDVTVAGHTGKRLRVSVPAELEYDIRADGAVLFPECDGQRFSSWLGRGHQGPGQIDDVWALDVHGTLLVIVAAFWPDTSDEDRLELLSIIQSIESIELGAP